MKNHVFLLRREIGGTTENHWIFVSFNFLNNLKRVKYQKIFCTMKQSPIEMSRTFSNLLIQKITKRSNFLQSLVSKQFLKLPEAYRSDWEKQQTIINNKCMCIRFALSEIKKLFHFGTEVLVHLWLLALYQCHHASHTYIYIEEGECHQNN